MRVLFFSGGLFLWWLVTSPIHAAAPKPVTIQEITLLLHGGYTSDEILRETAGRPLFAPLDDASEKSLLAAGADARLLAALKSSRPALTDAEAAAARQQQAAVDERNAEGKAAYVSRMFAANKQAFEDGLTARKQAALNQLAGRFTSGQLVKMQDGQLRPCADDAMAKKKLFAFYLSASWCAPCRKFTPTLVKFYQDFAPKHPAFEVILVSQDKSAAAMENYLRQDAMPWPALAYDRRAEAPDLMKLAEGGIPRLILIDGAGRVVADSFVDGKYVGPQVVLDALTRLAAAGGG